MPDAGTGDTVTVKISKAYDVEYVNIREYCGEYGDGNYLLILHNDSFYIRRKQMRGDA